MSFFYDSHNNVWFVFIFCLVSTHFKWKYKIYVKYLNMTFKIILNSLWHLTIILIIFVWLLFFFYISWLHERPILCVSSDLIPLRTSCRVSGVCSSREGRVKIKMDNVFVGGLFFPPPVFFFHFHWIPKVAGTACTYIWLFRHSHALGIPSYHRGLPKFNHIEHNGMTSWEPTWYGA